MHNAHDFLTALTVVLGVAAVTTVVFQRLRQPVVLGYILAGLIIGPHVPIPLVASPEIVHTLAETGVILLMFGLGLEFTLGSLARAAPTAGITALLQCSLMVWLGYVAGQALGWTQIESIFCGALIAISSTTIIAKAFDEQGITGKLRALVVAILIVEDLVAVLLMAVLTTVGKGDGLSAYELALVVVKLVGFLTALVVGGLLVVPPVIRMVARLGRAETTVVASIGLCFALSLLAHQLGYSVALGAFAAGMLIAESGEAHRVEPLVNPVRDVFAAVFFVSVGMLLDPQTIVDHWVAVVVLSVVVIVGKIVSVAFGAFLTGNGTRRSVAAGMSLAQIGEFSFIIAGLGLTLGAVGSHLYPIAVAVSAITTLTTPWLIRASDRAGAFVDRVLPRPLQTFVTLYESWIERLGARRESRVGLRRYLPTILLDFGAVAAIVIAVSLAFDPLQAWVRRTLWDDGTGARVAVIAAAAALALPFCVGILRTTGRLAVALAEVAVPGGPAGAAPRTMLIATVRLAGVLVAGLPLVALTQPFLPGFAAAAVLVVALAVLAIVFWRTAADLHGHVRAASEAIVEALAARTAGANLETAQELLPGLGDLVRVEIPTDGRAAGRTLAELRVRATTGATVLAIVGAGGEVVAPGADHVLRAGDVLGIVGSHDAVEAATALLGERAPA